MRNKEETKNKLLKAVSRVIQSGGMNSVGVNSVAAEAGVDKVLIYRYFGGIDGLLSDFISQTDFFANIDDKFAQAGQINTSADLLRAIRGLFASQLREMSQNAVLREIMLWELSTDNPVARAIARKREESSLKLIAGMKKKFNFAGADAEAIISIISAAVSYLAIRSKTADVYTGIDLNSPKGWQRLENAIASIIDSSAGSMEIATIADE